MELGLPAPSSSILQYYESRDGLYELLSAIVSQVNALEKVQEEAVRRNECWQRGVLERRLAPLEAKVANIAFSIQGYTVSSSEGIAPTYMDPEPRFSLPVSPQEAHAFPQSLTSPNEHVVSATKVIKSPISKQGTLAEFGNISGERRSESTAIRTNLSVDQSTVPLSVPAVMPTVAHVEPVIGTIALSSLPNPKEGNTETFHFPQKEEKDLTSLSHSIANQNASPRKDADMIRARKSKPLLVRWRLTARRAMLMNRIKGIFKNNEAGIENTRLHPSMNIHDRLARLDDFVFEIHSKLRENINVASRQGRQLEDQKSDQKRLADIVTNHDKKHTSQEQHTEAIKINLGKEALERAHADKLLKDHISQVVEKKLDLAEKRGWENSAAIGVLDTHRVKLENRVNDNAENVTAIQEELSRPAQTNPNKGLDNTDWTFAMEFSKQLHGIINSMSNEKVPDLKSHMEKCFRILGSCIELARLLKDRDDGRSPDSRKLTKMLESLAWMLHTMLKIDSEKSLEGWEPLESIYIAEARCNLKIRLLELATFVHDATKSRLDTVDLQIQIKEHENLLLQLNDFNVKQQEGMQKMRLSLKERAKAQNLQELTDLTKSQFEEIKQSLIYLKSSTDTSIKNESQLVSAMQENMERTMNATNMNMKSLKEDLRNKPSLDNFLALSGAVKETQRIMEKDLPEIIKSMDSKASENSLRAMRSELLQIISGTKKDKQTTMLGGRTYCLSCQQPIKLPGPESEVHSYYDATITLESPQHSSQAHSLGPPFRPVLPVAKGAFPPTGNIQWTPFQPKHNVTEVGDNGSELPAMSKSKSASWIVDGNRKDNQGIVISQHSNKVPVISYTDKGGKTATKSLGGTGLMDMRKKQAES